MGVPNQELPAISSMRIQALRSICPHSIIRGLNVGRFRDRLLFFLSYFNHCVLDHAPINKIIDVGSNSSTFSGVSTNEDGRFHFGRVNFSNTYYVLLLDSSSC